MCPAADPSNGAAVSGAVGDVPLDVVTRLRRICDPLPEALEHDAWAGVAFRVRNRTFAHCVQISNGRPPAMSRHAGTNGPALVLTFESAGDELDALRATGLPFWRPPWRRTVVGMFLDADTDWEEVAELLVESYCIQAPRRLAAEVRAMQDQPE